MKKFLISLLVLAFCSANMLLSQVYQWEWQNPKPKSGYIWSSWFVDANTGWFVGENGTIQKTTNGGGSWIMQNSGVFPETIIDIQFIDANTGWACGGNGIIIKTTDGGTNWVPETSGTTNYLYSIVFINADTGWVAGSMGKIRKTTDGGATWVAQVSGTSREFNRIFFLDANNGWAVGDGAKIRHTTDGGTTWTAQTLGFLDPLPTLNDVHFFDANNGIVAGSYGALYRTTDSGTTWTFQPSIITSDFTILKWHFTDANNGWACGGPGLIINTTDAGLTWSWKIAGWNDGYFYTCFFIDANMGYVSWKNGFIIKTIDGGDSWTPITESITDEFVTDVQFINANEGWCSNKSKMLHTTNGGVNWETQTVPSEISSLESLCFIDGLNGWATDYNGKIIHTSDGGVTWTIQYSSTDLYTYDVYFIDANNGWVVGYPDVILHTNNGGENWVVQNSNTTYDFISHVFFLDENFGWATSYWGGTYLSTTDGGITWVASQAPEDSGLDDVHFLDINNGWMVGDYGIYHTSDGGLNWNTQFSTDNYTLYGINFLDANNGYVCGDRGNILFTTNGGTNWNDYQIQYNSRLYKVNFPNVNNGWVVGDGGTILKGTLVPALATPVLISPANLAQDVSTLPTFVWSSVPNADGYKLQVSKNSNFNTLVIDQNVIGTSFTATQLLEYNTIFYWRVNASNTLQTSPWSATSSFTTTLFNWQVVTNTGNSSTIIVPASINPMIGNRPFQTGDAIGLFYQQTAGVWKCGGYLVWNGNNLAITVWGDDDITTIKDGFAVNEPYAFRVWDVVNHISLPATATYSEGPNNYHVDGFSVLSGLNVYTPTTQNFNLPIGWSMISSYVSALQPDLDVIFDNVLNKIKIMKNGNGENYVPEFGINQIGNWNFLNGYQIKVTDQTVFSIYGLQAVPETNPIPLIATWNLVSYLRNSPISIISALNNLSTTVVICKNGLGQMYVPAYGINQIGNMNPGEGYYLNVNTVGNLIYPPNGLMKTVNDGETSPLPCHLMPVITRTGNNASLILTINSIDGNEVGIYNTSNQLIGSGVIQKGIAAITIWGDDNSTDAIEGAVNNEILNARLLDVQTKTFYQIGIGDVKEILSNTDLKNLNYIKDGLFIASGMTITGGNLDLSVFNLPNPFSGSTNIEYSIPSDGNVEINLYNVQGELVTVVFNGTSTIGTHNLGFESGSLSSGVYNLIVRFGSQQASTKLMLVK
jgi:photosystem II stability/assembly factor-like uncharacterized protein